MSGSIVQPVAVVFAPGASVSAGVPLSGHIVSVVPLIGWGPHLMGFEGSHDPASVPDQLATWWSLIEELSGTELTRPVVEGRAMPLSPVAVSGFGRIRLRRGLLASPQAWAAGGSVLLGTRAYA